MIPILNLLKNSSLYLFGVMLISASSFAEAGYYESHAHGWHWYESSKEDDKGKVISELSTLSPLETIENIKNEIETKRAKALLEPNEKNVYEYIKTQELWTDQAEKFSKTWQWVIAKHPELNYSLRFPTSELAKQVKQKENSQVINMAISDIAQNYGIFYFYKSSCPYCERFSPILRTFGDRYKIKILAISLDGKATKGFNIFKSDNGIAEKWGIIQVPAIYAVSPLQDEVIPIAFGLISRSELEQRFLLFYENLKGREHATLRTVNH
ncbi:conjugal transfer protein TraF [Candidatus Berkiella aquae]|uniref:Conjugal transfer protein TraF n=1 Tax=Candidatus Berkiella aquae TaxID=295108 RepID=A0A0Q9YT82_9GAMM|nr:conjugal transfer protein TraF [Candidatus Berkiella aquae]MCS5712875.1 conjugal transfer protein TraF [Candidatus Berkiella aquae]